MNSQILAVLFPFDAIKIQFDSRYPCDNYDKLTDVIVNQRKSTKNKNGKHTVNLKRVKCDPSALNVDSFLIRIVRGTEHCQKTRIIMPTPMENRDPCEWLYTTNRNEFTSSWSIVTLQTCAKLYGGKAIATGLNWLDGIQLWYRHRSNDATNSLESCSYNRCDIGSHIYIQTLFPIVVLPAKQNSP